MNMIMFSLAILFVVFGVCEIVIGLGGWRALGAALRPLAEDKTLHIVAGVIGLGVGVAMFAFGAWRR
jgi:hypothetical protein